MNPRTFLDGKVTLYPGDCRDVLRALPDASIDSVVTDPPYALVSIVKRFGGDVAAPAKSNGPTGAYARASAGFMGKKWDTGETAFAVEFWEQVLRVLKPGGHVVAFSGTRTYHRMACAIEDAGFEIRDQIGWAFGSGFPKSHNVSKQLDAQEKNYWLNVVKAVDNCDELDILREWKKFSETANNAGLKFAKSPIETGTSTSKSGSARAHVLLPATPKKSSARAIIAELSSGAVPPTDAELSCFALSTAAEASTASSAIVTVAALSLESREATPCMLGSTARSDVGGTPSASTQAKLKAAEALKTWLGSARSSRLEDTAALCAALTDALKLIMLNRSKTFQSFDMKSQTDFASAMTVTITESTAANLIAFMAATLRSKGIDRAAGAEREVVGVNEDYLRRKPNGMKTEGANTYGYSQTDYPTDARITAPATDAAKQWEGWGTALKPSWEPICLARKPLSGTVASNVLLHGVGGLNIDACRVGYESASDMAAAAAAAAQRATRDQNAGRTAYGEFNNGLASLAPYLENMDKGRWPANLIHDGSEDVLAAFPDAGGQLADVSHTAPSPKTSGIYGKMSRDGEPSADRRYTDSGSTNFSALPGARRGDAGSAARFFYTAKADGEDRLGSRHPTVKPIDLMQWLVRLITPKGGVVLDPFSGTGTTGEAAWREGCSAILIEREEEYQADIVRRMELATNPTKRAAVAATKNNLDDPNTLPLFARAAE